MSKSFKTSLLVCGQLFLTVCAHASDGGASPLPLSPPSPLSELPLTRGEFESQTAASEELSKFGLPPALTTSAESESAEAVAPRVARGVKHIEPLVVKFEEHVPTLPAAGEMGSRATTLNSYAWSGAAIATGAQVLGTQSVTGVLGEVLVPVAQPAFGVCSGSPVFASEWVGLDGVGSGDIVQAGVETDAVCRSGTSTAAYYIWFEWYPFPAMKISNLPVSPGNLVYFGITMRSPTSAGLYVFNETTNVATSLILAAPPNVRLTGSSAEWIVERPSSAFGPLPLTNYVATFISNTAALLNDGHGTLVAPGGLPANLKLDMFNMVDGSGNSISTANLLGWNSFRFQSAGSAR